MSRGVQLVCDRITYCNLYLMTPRLHHIRTYLHNPTILDDTIPGTSRLHHQLLATRTQMAVFNRCPISPLRQLQRNPIPRQTTPPLKICTKGGLCTSIHYKHRFSAIGSAFPFESILDRMTGCRMLGAGL